jgi:L-histidine N-alpha-methyltransferase
MSMPASAWLKTEEAAAIPLEEFAAEVRSGLCRPGQKELHSKYLYDGLGSALFEAITFLPEYGLTRADERLIQTHAAEIARGAGSPVYVVELGSGGGRKTRPILEAIRALQTAVRYSPIDVSTSALRACRRALEDLADVHPFAQSYLDGLASAVAARRGPERLLVLFLGSTIGNFERPRGLEFLKDVRGCLRPGDALLLGADLVKPVEQLIPAYDDPTGVTAAFNLNLLGRVNRELGGNFNLRNFRHEARYNTRHSRIEMHLRALASESVSIPAAQCVIEFSAGETIWTESSHKYRVRELPEMAVDCGFRSLAQWIDREWPFAESLWLAA